MTESVKNLDLTRQAKRLMELFPTSSRCHGTYDPDPQTFERVQKDGGAVKLKPRYREVHEPLTLALWEGHIAGSYPVVAALACDDGTTRVSVLDIDHYRVDHVALAGRIADANLPLYVCKTKSGGAHVYAFHDQPISIAASERVTRGIARALGYAADDGGIEVFPRTQRLKPDGARPLPHELNMPFGGGRAHFIKRTGAEMTLDEFLAGVRLMDTEQREALSALPEQKESRPTTSDEGRAYAAAKLRRYENELRNAQSDGNNLLNRVAFHMGTMVARGWIESEDARQRLDDAIAHWTNRTNHLNTLDRALADGAQHPHADLVEEDAITEDGVALEFAERHAADLRFDHHAGKWYRWTGSHWAREQTPFAFAEARDLVRQLSQNQRQRVRNVTSRANFSGNVEKLARTDRALVATQETWDRDKLLLGTPNGTVDLRTGELRDPDPLDFISKQAAVAPAQTADCPQWFQFLADATSGDQALVDFLQVLCGYGLTGEVREHIMVFVHGDGGNGKGVFLNTVRGVFGDYAIESAPDMFIASAFDRHPTDIADLRGARLVSSSDTSTGKTWDDDKIKRLTGGDKVKGRFMRQDFFEFWPEFLLLFVGNEPPALRSVSAAMRRRLVMVPFVHRPKKPDTLLTEKLRQEWPGILRWMVDGCLRWQREGIVKPGVVEADTETYFSEQDIFSQWFEFKVQRVASESATLSDTVMFENWESFAARSGVREPGDKRWFNAKLRGEPYRLDSRKSNGQTLFMRVTWKAAGGRPDRGQRGDDQLPGLP